MNLIYNGDLKCGWGLVIYAVGLIDNLHDSNSHDSQD